LPQITGSLREACPTRFDLHKFYRNGLKLPRYLVTEGRELGGGTVVRDAAAVKKGDLLKTRFAKGTIRSEVKENDHG